MGRPFAQRVQRPLHRPAQIISGVCKTAHPVYTLIGGQGDPRQVTVIGPCFQGLGPPVGQGNHGLAKAAQIGKAFGGQLLNRNDQGCPFAHQHHRHTHAQIAPRAGQSFGKGKGKRHGITSYTILGAVPQFETIPSLATRPRESTVTYLAVGPCQVHLT